MGSRFHGAGNAMKRRGKGSKGGWGRAGMHKHRWSYITAYEPDFYGVHGFARPKSQVEEVESINLYEINQRAG